jgi:hypothetical protein
MKTLSLSFGSLTRRVLRRHRAVSSPVSRPPWLLRAIDDARAGRNLVGMTVDELRVRVGLGRR